MGPRLSWPGGSFHMYRFKVCDRYARCEPRHRKRLADPLRSRALAGRPQTCADRGPSRRTAAGELAYPQVRAVTGSADDSSSGATDQDDSGDRAMLTASAMNAALYRMIAR